MIIIVKKNIKNIFNFNNSIYNNNYNKNKIKVTKNKDLFIDIINSSFKLYNKKSKNGHYKNSTNSPIKLNQFILNIKNKIKNI